MKQPRRFALAATAGGLCLFAYVGLFNSAQHRSPRAPLADDGLHAPPPGHAQDSLHDLSPPPLPLKPVALPSRNSPSDGLSSLVEAPKRGLKAREEQGRAGASTGKAVEEWREEATAGEEEEAYPGTGIPDGSANIGILVVYTNYSAYQHATHTLLCYAQSRNYQMVLTQPYEDSVVQDRCSSVTNIYFLKLCAALAYLDRFDFLFFTDGDNAVLNPRHRLEEYIHPKADLIFYERFFSGEIASGSFFVRNSAAGRNFIHRWAHMEPEMVRRVSPLLEKFTSNDNGMLHLLLVEVLYPQYPHVVERMWRALNETSWPDWQPGYGRFVNVAKRLLIDLPPRHDTSTKVLIHPRAQGWARDTNVTMFYHAEAEFLAHGVKDKGPFDPAFLQRLLPLARRKVPSECRKADWAPVLVDKDRLVSVDVVARALGEAATFFEDAALHPLFGDPSFHLCWPTCPWLVKNF